MEEPVDIVHARQTPDIVEVLEERSGERNGTLKRCLTPQRGIGVVYSINQRQRIPDLGVSPGPGEQDVNGRTLHTESLPKRLHPREPYRRRWIRLERQPSATRCRHPSAAAIRAMLRSIYISSVVSILLLLGCSSLIIVSSCSS